MLVYPIPKHVPLVTTRRGNHTENVYYGSYAVVNAVGEVIAQAGDVQTPVFTRSALKPFQALPLVAHPDVQAYRLEPAELALLCASHNGEDRHVQRAARLLARIGADAQSLQCGVHTPYWYTYNNQPVPTAQTWSALHHNCSGKHAGFLLLGRLLGQDLATYLAPESAVQRAVKQAVAYAAGYGDAVDALPWGVDGCSAPNFALPLSRLARAYAWLATTEHDARYGDAPKRLYDAMVAHPEMVSGEGRSDLALAQAGQGAWVNKVGAEAVQTLGSRKYRFAIALKMSDGNQTAMMVAFCAILRSLNVLNDEANAALSRWATPTLQNIRGNTVGTWQALF